MKYTKKQIEELKNYLGYCVKEGAVDYHEAIELVEKKKWKEIDELREKGDYLANSFAKGEL